MISEDALGLVSLTSVLAIVNGIRIPQVSLCARTLTNGYEVVVDYKRLKEELDKDCSIDPRDVVALNEYYRYNIKEYNDMMIRVFIEFFNEFGSVERENEDKCEDIINRMFSLKDKYIVDVITTPYIEDKDEDELPF